MPLKPGYYIFALLCSLSAASPSLAGGFYLQEQSPKEVGRAFSGGAAAADDPSTIFFNPAGMTELEGVQLSTGGTLLFITARQSNRGSTRTDTPPSTGPFGIPSSGSPVPITPANGNGGNPFDDAVAVPAFYASAHIGDSPVWLGLGISAPFGLKLGYAPDFVGRYDSLYSKLQTINIQPSAAVRVSDAISIGGGVDVQYIDVKLTNALPNRSAPAADGSYSVHGDDISVGWNLGILAKAGKARFGLHYRSRMKHDLAGGQTISGLLGPLAFANGSQDIDSPLTLPDIVTASAAFNIDGRTRLMATGRFYNWSVFKRIEIISESGNSAIKELHYKDSWSIALGGERDLSDKLTLRAGTMFDKTPTNADFLTTRVPDGNRTWATIGATYDLSDHLSFNLSYAHVFVGKQLMDRTDRFYGGPFGQVDVRTRTRNSGNVDMLATSLTARF